MDRPSQVCGRAVGRFGQARLNGKREGFGVAAIEAEAMEIPVVATRVGGVPEVVLDGETGILVGPGSSEQLAQAILTLIENPALRRQMGER